MKRLLLIIVLLQGAQAFGLERPEAKFGLPPGAVYRPGYALVWNGLTRCPDLVAEHVTAQGLATKIKRPDNFRPDFDLPREFRTSPADYVKSGYDIGHMKAAANAATPEEMAATFLLGNACPQQHSFNAGPWARLESDVRALVTDEAWIYTGPLFVPEKSGLRVATLGKRGIWIPTHFYKVVVLRREKELKVWSIVMPHRPLLSKPGDLAPYAASVDDVERASGIDLLDKLPADQQAKLESTREVLGN